MKYKKIKKNRSAALLTHCAVWFNQKGTKGELMKAEL